MNERIREILTQCQQESIDGPEYPHWTDLEKFAELIVYQMLEITDAHTEVFQTDRDRAVIEHIKQSVKTHFGVEE
jgi:predicted ATPase